MRMGTRKELQLSVCGQESTVCAYGLTDGKAMGLGLYLVDI